MKKNRLPPGRRSFQREKTRRFVITGTIAATVNLGLMALLVETAGFRGPLMENLANFISIEASIVFSFFLNRGWTWGRVPRRTGGGLAAQFLIFNLASGFAVLLRIPLFALLNQAGIHYFLNTALGIAAAAVLNFFSCDRLVFGVPRNEPKN